MRKAHRFKERKTFARTPQGISCVATWSGDRSALHSSPRGTAREAHVSEQFFLREQRVVAGLQQVAQAPPQLADFEPVPSRAVKSSCAICSAAITAMRSAPITLPASLMVRILPSTYWAHCSSAAFSSGAHASRYSRPMIERVTCSIACRGWRVGCGRGQPVEHRRRGARVACSTRPRSVSSSVDAAVELRAQLLILGAQGLRQLRQLRAPCGRACRGLRASAMVAPAFCLSGGSAAGGRRSATLRPAYGVEARAASVKRETGRAGHCVQPVLPPQR